MNPKTSINPQVPFVVNVDPLIAPLLPEYLANRHKDVQRFGELLAAKDFAALRKLGHNLRGSAGAYGLPPLSDLGGRIEDAAQVQDGAAIAGAVEELTLFLQHVKLAP